MNRLSKMNDILKGLNEFKDSEEIHDAVNELHFVMTRYFLNGDIEKFNYQQIESLREIAFVLFDLTMQKSFIEKMEDEIKSIQNLNIFILEQVCKAYYLDIENNKRVFIEQLFVTVSCSVLNDNPSKAYVLYNKYLKDNQEFNSLDSTIYKLIIQFIAGDYVGFNKEYNDVKRLEELEEDLDILLQAVHALNILIDIMKYGRINNILEVENIFKEIYQKSINYNLYSNIWIMKILMKVANKKFERSLWRNLSEDISRQGIMALIMSSKNPTIELWKHQIEILNKGLLKLDVNNIIDMPTSSGKTLIALMTIIKILEVSEESTCVYVVPTNALLNQIKNDIGNVLTKLDYLVKVYSSGYDSNIFEETNEFKVNTRVVVVTQEKLDSLIRKKEEFIDRCKLFIFDEFHNIESGGRGFIIEAIIAKIKLLSIGDNPKILLLSAVLPNVDTFSKWIGQDKTTTYSNHICRPTSQVKNIAYFNSVFLEEKRGKYKEEVSIKSAIYYGKNDWRLLDKSKFIRHIKNKNDKYSTNNLNCDLAEMYCKMGNVLIYTPNKKWFGSFTKKIINKQINLNDNEQDRLNILADYVANYLTEKNDLVKLLRKGIAYHHRDLPSGVKYVIESAFKEGLIKVLAATTTLAQGLNFPITTIIVGGLYQGDSKMLLSEFHNLIGRCGRAMRETEGYVVVPIKGDNQKTLKNKINNLKDEYLFSEPIGILSSLDFLVNSLDKPVAELTQKEIKLLRIYNSIIFDLMENGIFDSEEGYDLYIEELLFSAYSSIEKIDKLKSFTKRMVIKISEQVQNISNQIRSVLTRSGLCTSSSIKIYESINKIMESEDIDINSENNIKKLLIIFRDISEYSINESEDLIYNCLYSWINLDGTLDISAKYFKSDLDKTNRFISNVIIYKAAWFFSVVTSVYEAIIISKSDTDIIDISKQIQSLQRFKNLSGFIKSGVNDSTLVKILSETLIDREFLIKTTNIFDLHTNIEELEYFYEWSKTVSLTNAIYGEVSISKYESEQWNKFKNRMQEYHKFKEYSGIFYIDIEFDKKIDDILSYKGQPIKILVEKNDENTVSANVYTLNKNKIGKLDLDTYFLVINQYKESYLWASISNDDKLRANIFII
ncbi:DEAD/DEAH box helicase [Clostridium beijerinckii]|uniref:DEAD/DEAH box helicase n=1 Tax=Clostridium beijerinckii TaxID=1520 RepID=A0AAW3WGH4_CLOBE|nr:DEAD/DEAH box helicase [Clostridium beijerinckii]MBC2460320.1 DEAD/DEAH box helicase [Clostridium beijerinckii]MBC2477816.1 DEAD/DEAH box helicase [Clostridium beijerinckii]NOV59029.1 superfamily II DNA/RNA helicase [Clostridium beijerinckii]NOV71583.1 replicative superfamily II helicase [Clostridium beijerinckii]NOW32384.1 replicative superfamily II helicase [Clostridium beijerinckii]